jgi:DNA-binding MarR family transcriptional regulator
MARRFPTSEELALWRTHVETVELVHARVESRLHADTGLSGGDYRVLLALSEADDAGVRSSELALRLGWERSRLSGHLGRMERRGLVRREPCEEDARGSRVLLTDDGATTFHAATRPHLRAVKEVVVDALTPEQLAALADAATAMRRHLGLDGG